MHRPRHRGHTPLRVLESFRTPQLTTNPYIVQLLGALRRTPDLAVLTFSWRQALFGDFDVYHVHWPELMLRGATRFRMVARCGLTWVMLARLACTGRPIVRTQHNIVRPADFGPIRLFTLDVIDRLTTVRITLNPHTEVLDSTRIEIPHGHYVDWYSRFDQPDAIPGRLAYLGLIKPYKNVSGLLTQFAATTEALTLTVSGRPEPPELGDEVRALAERDPRVRLQLDYVSEEEFVRQVREAELVVLPFREMHNSGSILSALSLNRPVLVPAGEVNETLAREVGPQWVIRYQGDLTPAVLESAWRQARRLTGRPDLSARAWELAGHHHLAAFQAAART